MPENFEPCVLAVGLVGVCVCVCVYEGGGDGIQITWLWFKTKNPYVCVKRMTFCSYAKNVKKKNLKKKKEEKKKLIIA